MTEPKFITAYRELANSKTTALNETLAWIDGLLARSPNEPDVRQGVRPERQSHPEVAGQKKSDRLPDVQSGR